MSDPANTGRPADSTYLPPSRDDDIAAVDSLLRSALQRPEAVEPARTRTEADHARNEQQFRDADLDIALKKRVANWALGAATVVVVASIAAFYIYIIRTDEIASEVMIAWLTATVVEVLGIVAIIARYLFPGRPGHEPSSRGN